MCNMLKKLIVLLLLFLSASLFSQETMIFKLSHSIVGFGMDFGYITPSRIYSEVDFNFPKSQFYPAYGNVGFGYINRFNVYGLGLIGMYSTMSAYPIILVNYGFEFGYKYKSLIGGVFWTNNVGLGLKIGYCFNYK